MTLRALVRVINITALIFWATRLTEMWTLIPWLAVTLPYAAYLYVVTDGNYVSAKEDQDHV